MKECSIHTYTISLFLLLSTKKSKEIYFLNIHTSNTIYIIPGFELNIKNSNNICQNIKLEVKM